MVSPTCLNGKDARQHLADIVRAIVIVHQLCWRDTSFDQIHKSTHYPTLKRLRAERDHWEEVCGLYSQQED